jgi:CheY-like chemotaxis protein
MSSTQDQNQNPQRTLLYIEDNPANLLLVEQLIAERSNLKLLIAVNGYQGVKMACTHKPDIILMDINLPDINGLEAMKILHENLETVQIPVIALSSNAFPKQIKEGLKAGFFRYLTKPYKINELMNAIVVGLNDTEENCPTPLP